MITSDLMIAVYLIVTGTLLGFAFYKRKKNK